MNKNLLLPATMIAIILAVSVVYISPAQSAPPSTAIGISPIQTIGVPVGGTSKVNITLSNVKELFGWDGAFTFNPQIICFPQWDPIIFDIHNNMVYDALGETVIESYSPMAGSLLKSDSRLVYFDSNADGQLTIVSFTALESIIVDVDLDRKYDVGEQVIGDILPPDQATLSEETRIKYFDLNGDNQWSDTSAYFRYLLPFFSLSRAPTLDCELGTVAAGGTVFPLPSAGLTGSFDAAEVTFVVLVEGFETPLKWIPESVKFNVNCGIQCREFTPSMIDGFLGSVFDCRWRFVAFKVSLVLNATHLIITARVQNAGSDDCLGFVRHIITYPSDSPKAGQKVGPGFDSDCRLILSGETTSIVVTVPRSLLDVSGTYEVNSFLAFDSNNDGFVDGPNSLCGIGFKAEFHDRVSPSEFSTIRI